MDTRSVVGIVEHNENRPSPEDFVAFVPWVCTELQLDFIVTIHSITLEKPTSFELKSDKMKHKTSDVLRQQRDVGVQPKSDHNSSSLDNTSIKTVQLSATHDTYGNLIMLKFLKIPFIPFQVLKVIEKILPYHRMLTNIVINQGLDHQGLHQLIKIVNLGCVTDLCLDNTAILDGWYDLILEKKNKLKNLSLARCKIEDETLKKIAGFLMHPSPASQMLQTLNLASNCITDIGTTELGVALRSNRRLVYLNLCDNKLSDDGIIPILDALIPFLLTNEEIMSSRRRKLEYIKEREYLSQQIIKELKTIDNEKKHTKKLRTPSVGKKTKEERENSLSHIDAMWYEKAKIIAEERMGQFEEPFAPDKIFDKNGLVYSYGNNALAYINISYNHISLTTVKEIVNVLLKQQVLNRRRFGLVNIVIEGNNIPRVCKEFEIIDNILLSKIPHSTKVKK